MVAVSSPLHPTFGPIDLTALKNGYRRDDVKTWGFPYPIHISFGISLSPSASVRTDDHLIRIIS